MEITGLEVKPVYDRPRTGDIKDSLADITAATEALGYYPDYDMNSGLKETVKWFQKI
jgi:UDP-glucose 4-epimerase